MKEKIPQHVAIIMDGNGRWAENKGLSRSEGHRAGVDVVKLIVQACIEHQIPVVSFWAFGRDNWARPQSEVDFLMELLLSALQLEIETLHQNGVRLRFTGDRSELSEPIQQAINSAEVYTQVNTALTVNIVFNYSGKWDIVEATKKIAQEVQNGAMSVQDINERMFSGYLNTHDLPEPDLFIRTSGEQRLSNFFLWQLAYTELFFSDVCWPDFTAEDFAKALICFAERERRYGKISQQLTERTYV